MSDKRDEILKAALELFAERGFFGTTVPEVAERARVGAGTIYRYFPSKEALVNTLYQRWKLDFALAVFADLPITAPLREQFRTLWQRLTQFCLTHPAAMAFLELQHHAPYLDDLSRTIEERVMSQALAFAKQASEKQVLKDLPPELIIGLVLGAFVGMMKAHSGHALPLTEEIIAAAEQCCWEAIRR